MYTLYLNSIFEHLHPVAPQCYLFIEYAISAGHYKNMYTHRNEKKRHKHSGKSIHT